MGPICLPTWISRRQSRGYRHIMSINSTLARSNSMYPIDVAGAPPHLSDESCLLVLQEPLDPSDDQLLAPPIVEMSPSLADYLCRVISDDCISRDGGQSSRRIPEEARAFGAFLSDYIRSRPPDCLDRLVSG